MNTTEPTTPEEAQRRLEERRRELGVMVRQPLKISIEQDLEEVCKRVLQVPSVPVARPDNSDRISKLKLRWNAPDRHLRCKADCSGEWGNRLETLKGRLGKGFLVGLIGGNGPGKTQLGVELMRYQVERRLKSALYCTAIEFFMSIKGTYRKDSDEREEDVLKRFRSPALLIVDEIGKRSDSAWENLLLFELLDRRYRDEKDTVIISNQTRAEFADGIGTALVDRLNESGGIVECGWGSFR